MTLIIPLRGFFFLAHPVDILLASLPGGDVSAMSPVILSHALYVYMKIPDSKSVTYLLNIRGHSCTLVLF